MKRVHFALLGLGVLLVVCALPGGEKRAPGPGAPIETGATQLPIPDEVAVKNLTRLLGELGEGIENGFVPPGDQEEMARLFTVPGVSDGTRARDALFLAWHARTLKLPPGIVPYAQAAAKNLLVLDDDDFSPSGAYWDARADAPQVALSLPEYLQGSLAEVALEAHELERAVQLAYIRQRDPVLLRKFLSLNDPSITLLRERLASRVTWELLHPLPRAAKEALLDRLLTVADFRALPGAEVVAGDLKDSDLSFDEYWKTVREVRGLDPAPASKPVVSAPQVRSRTAMSADELQLQIASPDSGLPVKRVLHDTDLRPDAE